MEVFDPAATRAKNYLTKNHIEYLIDTDHIENTAYNISFIVAFILVTAGTYLS
jgi:hypothetical protein